MDWQTSFRCGSARCPFTSPKKSAASSDIGPTIQEQLDLDPFAKVLQSRMLERMLAIHTTTANLYERLWCPFEMSQALSNTVRVAAAASQKYNESLTDKFAYFLELADG